MIRHLQNYVKKHKVEVVILLIILLVASFFRLYRIADYMTFLGDEGRDVIVAKDILRGDLTLLGPRASAGDFFLGPAYYYMMAPFLLLSGFDPVGPAIMVALFGIATVFLIYYVGKKLLNAKAALIAAGLYALSPVVIAYSRSSWNPNPMPFFTLLFLYILYRAVEKQSWRRFLGAGILLGLTLQLHYLATFLGVIAFFLVLIGNTLVVKSRILVSYVRSYWLLAAGFFLSLSPFLLFELRHGFPNITAIYKFIVKDNASETYLNTTFLGNIWDVFFRLYGRLVTKFPPPDQIGSVPTTEIYIWQYATIALAIISVISLLFVKNHLTKLVLFLWLFFGVFLFGFYKGSIYDYYLGFLFPLPFILTGWMLHKIARLIPKIGIAIACLVIVVLVAVNLTGAPFLFTPNKQKDQAKGIANLVLSKTNNQPFNFALLTRGNSDHVYRYFFEVQNRAPVTIENLEKDPERKSVTGQLMIVCEYMDCQPLGDSLWEVAGFGRAEITGEWTTPHVKVFRLVPYEEK